MTIKELNNLLRQASLAKKSVNEYGEGDIYENLNNGEHKYGYVNFTINSVSRSENTYSVNCYLFYVDRLIEDNSNKLDIWSTGCYTLQQIMLSAQENAGTFFDFNNASFTTFTEKFNDLCAGVYFQCDIEVLNTVNECGEDSSSVLLEDMDITINGDYTIGTYNVHVNVPTGDGTLNVMNNGEYVADEGEAYKRVVVSVPSYKSEYDDALLRIENLMNAIEDLEDTVRQQAELISDKDAEISVYEDKVASVEPKTITENGTYTTSWDEDDVIGWNTVTVNVQPSVVYLSQAEYNALVEAGTIDNNTLYIISCDD